MSERTNRILELARKQSTHESTEKEDNVCTVVQGSEDTFGENLEKLIDYGLFVVGPEGNLLQNVDAIPQTTPYYNVDQEIKNKDTHVNEALFIEQEVQQHELVDETSTILISGEFSNIEDEPTDSSIHLIQETDNSEALGKQKPTYNDDRATHERVTETALKAKECLPSTSKTDTIRNNDEDEEWIAEASSSENDSSSVSSGAELDDEFPKPYEGRPKKGRKRKHLEQTDIIRKLRKNSNRQHVTKRGKFVISKEFYDYHCSCSQRCYEKVPAEVRRSLFEKFWAAGNYEHQNSLICSLVKETKVKRKRVMQSEIRNYSRTYTISNVVVCRNTFTNTLRVSTKRINTALKKSRDLNVKDKRGRHANRKKISEERQQEIISQISKIPTYISHYRRNQTEKKFFAPDVTVEKMYTQYKNEVQNPVSMSSYKHIFYTNFNITRKKLKKDTCNTCDTFSVKISNAKTEQERIEETNKRSDHQKAAENARAKMNQDLENAKINDNIETLTFDLEKTLPLPRLPTGIVFYKRQLWLYNMGIHSGKTKKSHCFTWTEGTAGRGAQETASCLMKYIETNVGRNVTHLNLWSDSCGGQNRNIKLTLMMKRVLNNHPSIQEIRIRFLVSGHSFLPNDKDFGDIEKALKYHQKILTPKDYRAVMEVARKKNPLLVHEMVREDFYSAKPLEDMFVNRKVDVNGMKISWLETREIVLKKNSPYTLYFNKTFDPENLREVNIQGKRRGTTELDFQKKIPLLWPEGKKISSEKLQDVKQLMGLVEELNQEFYKNLMGDECVADDVDGYNVAELDFELDQEN